jgi:hypothetical protein
VILVNFQDKATQPYTPEFARGVVFNSTSAFDLENSFGQTSLTGDVTNWYTIALSSTVCDSTTLATLAKQAASANFDVSSYPRLVYAFPQNACSWWGLGSVGGNPSQAWINGSFALKVVGHEMGHNFGLYHSHSLDCGSVVLGGTCTASAYGDTIDIMGNPSSGHFTAFQKERLGWLGYGVSPTITTVLGDGVYTLEPYEAQTAGTKALKILQATDASTGTRTWYYVEYRQAIGFDRRRPELLRPQCRGDDHADLGRHLGGFGERGLRVHRLRAGHPDGDRFAREHPVDVGGLDGELRRLRHQQRQWGLLRGVFDAREKWTSYAQQE